MVKVIRRKLFTRYSRFPRHVQSSPLPVTGAVSVLSAQKASQPFKALINELINRDSLQLTREFDLKRHYDIKRHGRLNAPGDTADTGTTSFRPRNDAGAAACRRRASTTIYGRHTGGELIRPPPLPDIRSRSPFRSRSTSRSSPRNPRAGQRGPRSTRLNYRRLDVLMRLRKPWATRRR